MQADYPWTKWPLVTCAPMRLISFPPLAVETSAAGGLGFIGVGSDLDQLDRLLSEAAELIKAKPDLQRVQNETGSMPIGFGFFNWAPPEDLERVVNATKKWSPVAVWMFGAHNNEDYAALAERVRQANGSRTKIWIQVGSVVDSVEVVTQAKPDVLVVQGTDAGGHGLKKGAGIITLLPEVHDALKAQAQARAINKIPPLISAGGIIEGRSLAASLLLGADGVTLGTRFLASEEATIADGYRREVIRASDGGLNTMRTNLYDQLRGTTQWPEKYNARAVLNQSYHSAEAGMSLAENKKFYDVALHEGGDAGWGVDGRLTTYAGTGVGLVTQVMKAGDIVREVRAGAVQCLRNMQSRLSINIQDV